MTRYVEMLLWQNDLDKNIDLKNGGAGGKLKTCGELDFELLNRDGSSESDSAAESH